MWNFQALKSGSYLEVCKNNPFTPRLFTPLLPMNVRYKTANCSARSVLQPSKSNPRLSRKRAASEPPAPSARLEPLRAAR